MSNQGRKSERVPGADVEKQDIDKSQKVRLRSERTQMHKD